MERINKDQRKIIRQLHYRNEDFYDRGIIDYDEYIVNNFTLLRRVRNATLNEEQKIILAESISIEINLEKFRLGMKVAQLSFN